MSSATPHPHIEPLVALVGRWRGRGQGKYPTIASFEYNEELRFWHTGRPWIGYEQRTSSIADGAPMHSEVGYWRPFPDGRLELVIAHAFGIAEIEEGRIWGNRFEVKSKTLASTSTANTVEALTRVFEVQGDTLTYSVEMAFGDEVLQNHLSATLRREG